MNLDALLAAAVHAGASDIHLKLGRPPLIRLDGAVTPLEGPELTEEDLDSCLRALTAVAPQRYERRAVVELADIPGGYGWVFPKAEHANVGVGAWQSAGPQLREHLARLCAAHGLEPDSLTELRGHRLPLRRPGTPVAGERALLVGDAAGLIDPVSGDGMYECFVSSRLAAAAILDLLAGRTATLAPYAAALDAELGSLHRASWQLKQALDRWPRASWRLARSALVWRTVERLLLGDLASPREQHGLARAPLRALALLGR